jgi:peptidyl-prolyl cis-trans isomerase B (cyclophilin B)
MNRISLLVLFSCLILTACAQNKKGDYVVTIKTSQGEMVAILYNETPNHRDNFVRLINQKFYDSLLFHRVITDFMIQGGDPNSKKSQAGQPLGNGGPGYTVEAEFNPKYFHERGALSAARQGDQVNPKKASSGSQFYIVQGKKSTVEELARMEQNTKDQRKGQYLRDILMMPQYESLRLQINEKQRAQDGTWLNSFFENSDTLIAKVRPGYKPYTLSEEQKAAYSTAGGSPFLDGDYTVFGKVIKGLDVIDKIAALPKDSQDRPIEDIRMFITVKQMPRKKIEKDYGYIFPEEKK